MTPPIPRWSTSKNANHVPPLIAALLKDARKASRRGDPLYYSKFGFRNMKRQSIKPHSFATARAAERRGLVLITGIAPHRILHITGAGIDAADKLERKS